MHSRTIHAARTAACWREEPDTRKASVLWWVIPCFALWCAVIGWVIS
jgi:hypothetical protein